MRAAYKAWAEAGGFATSPLTMGLSYGLVLISPSAIWEAPSWQLLTGGPPPWLPIPEDEPDLRGVAPESRRLMAVFIAEMDQITGVAERQAAYAGKGELSEDAEKGRQRYREWVSKNRGKWGVKKVVNDLLEDLELRPLDLCRRWDQYKVSNCVCVLARD